LLLQPPPDACSHTQALQHGMPCMTTARTIGVQVNQDFAGVSMAHNVTKV